MTVAANGMPGISTTRRLGFSLGLFGLVLVVGVVGFKTLVPQRAWMEAMLGGTEEFGFRFEELAVGEKSELAGKSLESLRLSRRFGVINTGVLRQNGEMQFNPSADTELRPGDTLIAMGTADPFAKFRERL